MFALANHSAMSLITTSAPISPASRLSILLAPIDFNKHKILVLDTLGLSTSTHVTIYSTLTI